jgi:hypothetical protein
MDLLEGKSNSSLDQGITTLADPVVEVGEHYAGGDVGVGVELSEDIECYFAEQRFKRA